MALQSRRRFLTLALGAGATLGLAGLRRGRTTAIAEVDSKATGAARLQMVRKRSRALGSLVQITVLHVDAEAADHALDAAFAELELVEGLMSVYRPDSQLMQLNRLGSLVDPHPYLVQVLNASRAMSVRSHGAFDVTVQPLWQLYAACHRELRSPSDAELAAARRLVDWRQIEVSAKRVSLRTAGAAITLNGIAQGFAADCVAAVLKRHGIEHALVDTGELLGLGQRQDGQPWNVGIQHPRQSDAWLAMARLSSRALSTSGDYATTLGEGFQRNHLFDPRTGDSPGQFASVSIAAPTATLADAVSTAVFVLGLERGMELVRSLPSVDVFAVSKDGRTYSSAGFSA